MPYTLLFFYRGHGDISEEIKWGYAPLSSNYLQRSVKSYTIDLEKRYHANISRFYAFTALDLHAVNAHGGCLLFTAAAPGTPRICHLGLSSDLGPDHRTIFCDLDETWKSTS